MNREGSVGVEGRLCTDPKLGDEGGVGVGGVCERGGVSSVSLLRSKGALGSLIILIPL